LFNAIYITGEWRMNKVRTAILLGVILLFASNIIIFANATSTPDEGSLNSGYAITNNYHGIDTPLGASVKVTAMTTNHDVDYVTFIWTNAAGQIKYQENVNVFTNGTTYNGKLVRYAVSTHTADSLGDWGVQGKFYDRSGFFFFGCDERLATKATSFNVVPEVPLLGTAGIAAAMVLGLTVFKAKKKQ
jgi:hypothetical protein